MVDRLPELAIDLLCKKNIDNLESPQMMFDDMINKHRLTNHFATNLRTQVASGCWSRIFSLRSNDHQPSTACDFYTNCKPEWQNLTLDQCLRSLSHY